MSVHPVIPCHPQGLPARMFSTASYKIILSRVPPILDVTMQLALFALSPWQPIFSHWAENGPAKVQDIPLTYNPAFYGFSPTLVEVSVNSCTAICQNAGLDIDEYVHTPSDKSLSKKRRSRRRRGESVTPKRRRPGPDRLPRGSAPSSSTAIG
jgi:hypothetical protein